jgi:transcriptional regulator with XRE-family HTH domain
MDEPDWTRLAQAVKSRRFELGLSARAAAARANINRSTWATIEDGERKLSKHLWVSVERALDWAAGSIDSILAGGDPVEVLVAALADDPNRPPLFDLRDEYRRVTELPVSCDTKLALVGEIIELFLENLEARFRYMRDIGHDIA